MANIQNHIVKTATGQEKSLQDYKGKVLLIVNVASHCRYTSQYTELEELYQKYKDRGFEVLAFPCNQFGGQEPGDEKEITTFCSLNYGVTFPIFSKIDVNGSNAHPLFVDLKKSLPGLLGSKLIKWNFTKFLVDRHGHPVARYAPKDKPKAMLNRIENLINN